jgi:hypothetical protein
LEIEKHLLYTYKLDIMISHPMIHYQSNAYKEEAKNRLKGEGDEEKGRKREKVKEVKTKRRKRRNGSEGGVGRKGTRKTKTKTKSKSYSLLLLPVATLSCYFQLCLQCFSVPRFLNERNCAAKLHTEQSWSFNVLAI